jgi:hypothetical protein
MNSGDHFLETVQFSDEVTFHVSRAVNHCNVRIWGSENPHAYVEHQHDSLEVNVFCAISSQNVYGSFLFAEETVIGMTYLVIPTFIFQQERSPAHFHCEVHQYLNTVLPGCWTRHAPRNDQQLMLWPPRSPDIMPCDFLLCGYVKDRAFVPPLPRDLADLKAWITAAVKNINAPTLTRVWQDQEYHINVCLVTRVTHIKHL